MVSWLLVYLIRVIIINQFKLGSYDNSDTIQLLSVKKIIQIQKQMISRKIHKAQRQYIDFKFLIQNPLYIGWLFSYMLKK